MTKKDIELLKLGGFRGALGQRINKISDHSKDLFSQVEKSKESSEMKLNPLFQNIMDNVDDIKLLQKELMKVCKEIDVAGRD